MFINSVEVRDFRNYEILRLEPDRGINILYGDNAQGKTNVLEALYAGCTSRSHKQVRDRDMIRFGREESHIRVHFTKNEIPHKIDIHIKKNKSKGVAVDGIPIRRISELLGKASVVFFSPEDLSIIKNGPAERRKFIDIELCQMYSIYTHALIAYHRVADQKNHYLREHWQDPEADSMLDVYNEQLAEYGCVIIHYRKEFISQINDILKKVHSEITDGREEIEIRYEANSPEEEFKARLERYRQAELRQQACLTGPHRDDISFYVNHVDIRHFGSQGQQRTAALSLKLSEITLLEKITGDKPVLLLDDVLSELDHHRQKMLLDSIKDIQTLITCTGLDDFVSERFHIDRIFHVKEGTVTGEN